MKELTTYCDFGTSKVYLTKTGENITIKDSDGKKIYGVVKEIKHSDGSIGYLIDNTLATTEWLEDNKEVLEEMIAKFKLK